MQAGALVSQYVDSGFVPRLGAALLIGLGLWSILQSRGVQGQSLEMPKASSEEEDVILRLRLQPFGLVIQVWKEPFDRRCGCFRHYQQLGSSAFGNCTGPDAGSRFGGRLSWIPTCEYLRECSVVSFLALSSWAAPGL